VAREVVAREPTRLPNRANVVTGKAPIRIVVPVRTKSPHTAIGVLREAGLL